MGVHWFEVLRYGKSLVESAQALATGDYHRGGKAERVGEAFHRSESSALQQQPIAHRLHSEHGDALFNQLRYDLFLKAAELSIHWVQRHLAGIEMEVVSGRQFQHAKVHARVFMTGESNEPNLPGLLSIKAGFQRAVGSEEPVGILQADVFVKLHEVDAVGLQPP